MIPALLAAIVLMADAPVAATAPQARAKHGPHAVAAAVADSEADDDEGDIPAGAPTDDYGFTAWCYGALGEYLSIYDTVVPDLKDIDKMFGTSVQEDMPYSADVAAERVALKRFGAALTIAERSSARPIATDGVAAIQSGRGIWAAAKLQPHRKLADAWLFWGIPKRCETAAKALRSHAGHIISPNALSAAEQAALLPAPTIASQQAQAVEAAPPPMAPQGPPPPPPKAGAVLIDVK
jgi:hypothetical protein